MSTSYHVYQNDGAGGAVDYTTIVATTASLTYNVGPLNIPSDWTFAVRAFDTVSLLEEKNVDARVRIQVNAAGVDVSSLPNAPTALRVTPGKSGTATVIWLYSPIGQGGIPTGFHVYIGTPTISYASPVATVSYAPALGTFTANLSGLTGGATYQVGVRSFNATGEESNTQFVSFLASTAGPLPVTNLTSTTL